MIEDEKKTAPVSSVGADEEQPSIETMCSIPQSKEACNDGCKDFAARLRKINAMCDPNNLHTLTLNEIFDQTYPDRESIIEGLLYPGVYILAGAPKIGKSFLVAQIAYHVSKGLSLWGYTAKQGGVLYLALEDDFSRIQRRMAQMFGPEGEDCLSFAVRAKTLGEGLNNQLAKYVSNNSNIKLIIIDTFQKVRDDITGTYSYASDYKAVGQIKEFANEHKLCVLIVHHTRKQGAEDKFDKISGTNGLLGCADGAFVLEKESRVSNDAVLDISGRDIFDQRLHLSRNVEHLTWELVEQEKELWKDPPDPLLEALAEFVRAQSGRWIGTVSELAKELMFDGKPNMLSRYLNINIGKMKKEYGVKYEDVRNHDGRLKVLSLM